MPGTSEQHTSLQPLAASSSKLRRRLRTRDEFVLALLPTLIVLLVLFLVEAIARQRLLFASLASSAFLIYLDPQHGTNTFRSLVCSHLLAAITGVLISSGIGEGYMAAGISMTVTIVAMIALDVVHPPAVATSLAFAFRDENASNLILFGLALLIIAALVGIQRMLLWLLAVLRKRASARG